MCSKPLRNRWPPWSPAKLRKLSGGTSTKLNLQIDDQSAKGKMMKDPFKVNRRGFLKQAAGALGVAAQAPYWSSAAVAPSSPGGEEQAEKRVDPGFPRRFEGRKLAMIAFPLGGVAAGSISLGGCGQLRDWEIFNRPNKGFRPRFAFPSIWAQADRKSTRLNSSHLG